MKNLTSIYSLRISHALIALTFACNEKQGAEAQILSSQLDQTKIALKK